MLRVAFRMVKRNYFKSSETHLRRRRSNDSHAKSKRSELKRKFLESSEGKKAIARIAASDSLAFRLSQEAAEFARKQDLEKSENKDSLNEIIEHFAAVAARKT